MAHQDELGRAGSLCASAAVHRRKRQLAGHGGGSGLFGLSAEKRLGVDRKEQGSNLRWLQGLMRGIRAAARESEASRTVLPTGESPDHFGFFISAALPLAAPLGTALRRPHT